MTTKEIEQIIDKIDIIGQPPVKEPERQYYYMAKCRQLVVKESEKLGRTMTASVNTFGCQMNVDLQMG